MIGSTGGATRAVFSVASAGRHPVQPPDRHGAGVHAGLPADAGVERGAGLRRAVSPTATATTSPDYETAGKYIPVTGHADRATCSRRAATASCCRCSVPAGRQARWRLAGGHLRPRLHRQHVRRAVDAGVGARVAGHRDDLDQRGRPRRRRARHARMCCATREARRWPCPPVAAASIKTATAPSTPPKASSAAGAAQHHQQPRRPAPDGGRPDAAGAPDRSRHRCRRRRHASTSTPTASTTPASRSAASTAPSCWASSTTSRPACVNVPGGSITEIARLSPVFRPSDRASRLPARADLLSSSMPAPPAFTLQFNENIPLRDQPPLVNTVPGAMDDPAGARPLQWVQQSGNPVTLCAAHPQAAAAGQRPQAGDRAVRQGRPDGAQPDQPAHSSGPAIWKIAPPIFRNDLAFCGQRSDVGKNPHTFLTNIGSRGGGTVCDRRADADRHVLRHRTAPP